MQRRELLFGTAAILRGAATDDVLKQVAERYREAGRALSVVASIASISGDVPLPMAGTAVRHRFLTQDGLYRDDYKQLDEWVAVRGSAESWLYRGDRREYRQGPNNSELAREVESMMKDAHDRLGGRFALLGTANADVKTSEGELKIAGRKTRCMVLSLASRTDGWREKLWIDPSTMLVWKSVFDYPPRPPVAGGTRTTLWEEIRIGEPAPADTFVFVPPKRARRVERFSIHHGPYQPQ